MTFDSGDGEIGVENRGLNRWGMNFVAGKPYEGYVWARAEKPADARRRAGEPGRLADAMPRHGLNVAGGGEWRRLRLHADARRRRRGRAIRAVMLEAARLGGARATRSSSRASGAGSRACPSAGTWPRGSIDQGVTVLRYGGSMVNHPRVPLEEDDRPARPPAAVRGRLVSALLQRLGHLRFPATSARRRASTDDPDVQHGRDAAGHGRLHRVRQGPAGQRVGPQAGGRTGTRQPYRAEVHRAGQRGARRRRVRGQVRSPGRGDLGEGPAR